MDGAVVGGGAGGGGGGWNHQDIHSGAQHCWWIVPWSIESIQSSHQQDRPTSRPACLPANHAISQPAGTNQPTAQQRNDNLPTTNQPTNNQTTNQSTTNQTNKPGQPSCQLASKLAQKSINQQTNQPTNEPTNQPTNQPVNPQRINWWTCPSF
jgi:hypothetical protein